MLELIIRFLQANFQSVGYFDQVLSIAQKVKRDDKEFPAIYKEGDDLNQINLEPSCIYFKKRGAIQRSESNEDAVSGCEHLITVSVPLQAIAYLPKNIFKTDNAFIDDKTTNNIANIIQNANWKSLQSAMKAQDVSVFVRELSDDKDALWRQEYKNIPLAVRHDYVYCSVSFDIVIKIDQSCLINFECQDIEVTYSAGQVTIFIVDNSAWHKGGDSVEKTWALGTKTDFGFNFITNNQTRWSLTAAGNIVPAAANTYSLGSAALPVKDIYAQTLHYSALDPAIVVPVTSVNGQTGSVVLTTTDINEGTNLYYTDTRARASISASSPLQYNSGTGALSITDAGAAQSGVVNAIAQTFAGLKTFNNSINLPAGTSVIFESAQSLNRSGDYIVASNKFRTMFGGAASLVAVGIANSAGDGLFQATGSTVSIAAGSTERFRVDTNALFTNVTLIRLNGTTSAFPALKRSGIIIQSRLADDSAYAEFAASAYYVGATAGVDGTFTTVDGKTVTVSKGIITLIV